MRFLRPEARVEAIKVMFACGQPQHKQQQAAKGKTTKTNLEGMVLRNLLVLSVKDETATKRESAQQHLQEYMIQ